MITLMQALIAASVSVRPGEPRFYGPCSPGVHHPTGSYNFFLPSSAEFPELQAGEIWFLSPIWSLSLCLVFG